MIMALKIQDNWILFAMKWDHMKNKRTLEKLEESKVSIGRNEKRKL